jgi:hypothetical protein
MMNDNKKISPEDFRLFLAKNEHKIKELFPSNLTHLDNIDFNKLFDEFVSMGFVIKSFDEFETFLQILQREGFFIMETDYLLRRNDSDLYEMYWKA